MNIRGEVVSQGGTIGRRARSDVSVLGNESATPAAILQPHVRATAARCAQAGAVFVAHDSTELRFSRARLGLGRVAGDDTHGSIGHFAVAVDAKTR